MKFTHSPSDLQGSLEELFGEEREAFRQLIHNSFDMIVLLDADGIQRYVSESCRRVLGYMPSELTGIRVIEEMIHPEDREHVKKGFLSILEGNSHGGAQYRHRHKEGGWVYLEAFGSNLLDHPLIQSIVLNVRDITARRKAEMAQRESEARLREANKSKDRLFSIIGHDLRGPFNGIMGLCELLEDDVRNQHYEEVAQYSAMIRESAQNASNLLTNLLEWARTQTGELQFHPVPLNLTVLVRETLDLLGQMAGQKSITLFHHLPAEVPVLADKRMVQTILRNLVSNGIKFTKSGGAVEIRAREKESRIEVCVSDTGIGIPTENLERLFKIDEHLTTPGTHSEKGTGLGLSLCQEFVHLHNGTIHAQQLPNGSRICFTIPRG